MRLRNIKRRLPSRVLPLAKAVYRTYMRSLCWYVSLRERRHAGKTGVIGLPPASLRYRVHGSPHADTFLRAGKKCSKDIEAALAEIGRDLDSFRNVLDFGCGCGRTLLGFADRSLRLRGTDIDAEAISWCRDSLDFVEFGVNEALPPLAYPSETFDLVYAISVFTHLDEDFQFRWLNELKRITKPGGIVLLTVHGHRGWKDLREEDVADIEKKGFKFVSSNTMKGIFPEWYQNAYHKKEYVLDEYSRYFDVLDYIPRGMNNHQDVVVLRAPQDGPESWVASSPVTRRFSPTAE